MVEQALIGASAMVIVATRGDAGLGEISLSLMGATQTYLAWSQLPLARGTQVVVTGSRGPRTVEVESLEDLIDPPEEATAPDDEPPDLLAL